MLSETSLPKGTNELLLCHCIAASFPIPKVRAFMGYRFLQTVKNASVHGGVGVMLF